MAALRNKTSGLLTGMDYRKKYMLLFYAALIIALVLAALISVLPPLWMFFSAFKSVRELFSVPYTFFPADFRIQKFLEVWEYLEFEKVLLNSLISISGAVVCSVFFNGLMAFVTSVIKPAGYKIVHYAILGTLMVPSVTGIVVLFENITMLGLTNTYVPLWLIYGANAFYYVMFKNYFDSIPSALTEAAKIDGAGKLQIFFRIILPLATPIIMVVIIFTINASWSDFLLPYLVLQQQRYQTVMVKLYHLYEELGNDPDFTRDKLLMALSFSIIPPVLLFFVFQRFITENVTASGIKG